MANVKMGFEGLLYYGTAGATASTLIQNCKDITISGDLERGDTTVRGDSTAPPIRTEDACIRILQIEWQMIVDSTDTVYAALKAAAANGTLVALRGKDYSSGKGPDADFSISHNSPMPLNGEQVVTFTAIPSRSAGRTPLAYV